MTIMNFINLVVVVVVVVAVAVVIVRLQAKVRHADGVGEVNELGEDGESDDGISLGEVGVRHDDDPDR